MPATMSGGRISSWPRRCAVTERRHDPTSPNCGAASSSASSSRTPTIICGTTGSSTRSERAGDSRRPTILNPVPTDVGPRILSTYIDEFDGTASLDQALATAEYYGLDPEQARRIAGAAGKAVSEWREVAARLGGSRREVDRMESAFEHEDLARARQLGAG